MCFFIDVVSGRPFLKFKTLEKVAGEKLSDYNHFGSFGRISHYQLTEIDAIAKC